MTFEIDVNGRRRVVSVQAAPGATSSGGRFRVMVQETGAGEQVTAGRTFDVDVRPTELGVTLIDQRDGRSLDAALTETRPGQWFVQLDRVALDATVNGRRFRRGTELDSPRGDVHVSAPMPGRIVRVLVAAGDSISARQGLVVVEAMKMENELTAPRSGVVKEVAVSEGMSVEAGRLLVRIE
jgi:biotin carboxyl carrier protein